MLVEDKIWISKNDTEQYIELKRMNRHGLISGATGTGKTTTLRVLAESLSKAGIPVFAADIKGDLSGLAEPGHDTPNMIERRERIKVNEKGFTYQGFPVTFWDVFGEKGHPVRATISEMGPILLSNILNLTPAQEGILNIAFRLADENGLLLLDLADLKAMLQYIGDHASEATLVYGNVTKASVGALLREILALENEGGDKFFGETSLDLEDWFRNDESGKGYINILECEQLFQKPRLYATFMLWMLSMLYDLLPEVGDLDKPKMVFFFDEAHLLFNKASESLIDKINQIVRLIRSKGVGVFFITQSPMDLPDSVLAQLGNRIQHGMHAYTPNEIKKVKAASDTFRANPAFKTDEAILNLGIGEALVSFIDEKGVPSMVEKTFILPPESNMEALSPFIIKQISANDSLAVKYDTVINRESAAEMLAAKYQEEARAKQEEAESLIAAKEAEAQARQEALIAQKEQAKREKEEERQRRARERQIESFTRSVTNTFGREITKKATRTLFGILKK